LNRANKHDRIAVDFERSSCFSCGAFAGIRIILVYDYLEGARYDLAITVDLKSYGTAGYFEGPQVSYSFIGSHNHVVCPGNRAAPKKNVH
jgi:hypothetical protein